MAWVGEEGGMDEAGPKICSEGLVGDGRSGIERNSATYLLYGQVGMRKESGIEALAGSRAMKAICGEATQAGGRPARTRMASVMLPPETRRTAGPSESVCLRNAAVAAA